MNIKQMAESPRESHSHERFSLFQSFISSSPFFCWFFFVFFVFFCLLCFYFILQGHHSYSVSWKAQDTCGVLEIFIQK